MSLSRVHETDLVSPMRACIEYLPADGGSRQYKAPVQRASPVQAHSESSPASSTISGAAAKKNVSCALLASARELFACFSLHPQLQLPSHQAISQDIPHPTVALLHPHTTYHPPRPQTANMSAQGGSIQDKGTS